MAYLKCDVCGRNDIPSYVASSSIAAASWCYCQECIKYMANPELEFHYLYDMVSRDGEGLDPAINEMWTWKDGKYIKWPEWKAWRQHPDNKARLDAQRDADLEELAKM